MTGLRLCSRINMRATSHYVTTKDGTRISFDQYPGQVRDTAVIVCPGFFQSKETATFRRLSAALAVFWDVLAMDFRGHGRSSGLFTFSAEEHADLEVVLAWAQARYAHLAVLGFSLGAATAIHVIGRHPDRVRGLVAVSAPSSFEEIEFKFWTPEAMRTGMVGLERGSGCRPGNLLLKKQRPVETIREIDAPLLIIHGTNDVIIDIAHSRRLFTAACAPKRLAIVEGGSHAEALFRDDPDGFIRLIQPWLACVLGC